ncbi:MAG TPA: putative Ig domain-containing protein [Opitutaceae bacterium]|nr:putative Ig domain-containing protein [Opitutaceae bacterium]
MRGIRFLGFALLAAAGVGLRAQTAFPASDGFDPNANSIVNTLAVQPDGKILMGGYFTQLHPFGYPVSGNAYIARLNHDGSVDAGFSPNANGVVRTLLLQPNGQIILGGDFTAIQPTGGGAAVPRGYVARLNADGSLDSVFSPNANGVVYAVAYQPNGQIVIGGSFTSVQPGGAAGPTTRNHIARFNVDGSLDTSFDPDTDRPVLALAVQPNGQVVVGGGFSTLQPNGAATATTRNCVARLNSDGSLDTGFDPEANGSVDAIAVLPNGQVIIGGEFVQLQPNGATGPIQADFLARLNSDGTIDQGFIVNPLASVNAVAVQGDGRLLIGGTFQSIYPENSPASTGFVNVARINTDGSIDFSFDPAPDQAVNAIAVQQDGGVILGGFFRSLLTPGASARTTRNFIARVSSDSSLDATMAPDASGTIYAAVPLSNGQVIVGGTFLSIGGSTQASLARLNADGSLDSTFLPTVNGPVYTIAVQSDGKFIVGGNFTTVDGISRNYIARLNPDGTVDGPFNPNANSQVKLIALQSNGQILISGYFTTVTPNGTTTAIELDEFARLNSDGSADLTFNPSPTGGSIFAIAFQSDGKMIVAGEFTSIGGLSRGYVARLLSTGVVDPADFDPEANGPVYALAIQGDGKVVMGGGFTAVIPQTGKIGTAPTATSLGTNTTITTPYGAVITVPQPGFNATVPIYINHMARFNADGTLDTTFFPDPSATVQALALQQDGSIVVGGFLTSFAQNGNPTGTIRNYVGRVGADGSLDAKFDPNASDELNVVSLFSDGKILVAGAFTTLQPNGAPAASQEEHVAILNADGSIDSSFSEGRVATASGQVSAAALLPSGQMLIGGSFSPIGGAAAANLCVFNPDGSASPGFDSNFDGPVNAISVQPKGASTPAASSYAAWLESTGAVRYLFSAASNGQVSAVVQQSDGKVLVGGLFAAFAGVTGFENLVRINTDGTVDTSFNPVPDGQVSAIVIQPDGKILIGGNFTAIVSATGVTTSYNYLARLNPDGTVDTTFDPEPNLQVASLALQSDGKIIVGGYFTGVESKSSTAAAARNYIARLNSDGSVDTAFNPDLNGVPFAIVVLSNGQILIGGAFTSITPNATGTALIQNGLARLNSDGTLDTTFNPNPNGTVFAVTVQPNGEILVGGNFTALLPNPTYTTVNGVSTPSGTTYPAYYLARLNTNGLPDTSFNPYPNSSVTAITLQANGQMLVGGNFNGFSTNGSNIFTNRNNIARINPDGSVDPTFDPELNSAANAIAVLSDGSVFIGGYFTVVQTGSAILVGGSFTHVGGYAQANMVRLNADSTVDGTFASNPDGPVNAIAAQGTGGAFIGGAFANVAGHARSNLAHLNSDGSLDTSFNTGANAQVNVVALEPNGQVVVGGAFTSIGGQPVTYLARLGASGSPDASFAPVINGTVNAVDIQANGQIVIAGAFTSVAGQPVGGMARLNSDGSLDASFNPNANGTVEALALQVDGTFLAGGSFTTIGGQPIAYVAHIEASGAVDTAFNPGPNGPVYSIMVQPDGKVVLGGSFTTVGGLTRYLIARLSTRTAVTQSLTASADESTITWTRGGGAPALSSVEFEETVDGTHFVSAGQATSVDGSTWQVTGVAPTKSTSFVVLAIGVSPASRYSSSGLIEASEAVNTLAIPVVDSASTATGNSGTPFSFTVTATQLPTSFTASGLPPGLSINSTTGVISGTPTGAGTYNVTVTVSNSSGASSSSLTISIDSSGGASFAPSPSSSSDRLLNLSCRAELSGSNILIAGFVISGTGQKTVLLRAVGPGLAAFGVAGVMANPELELYSGSGALIAQNSGWGGGGSLAATFAQVGAFALAPASADAAAVVSLSPGPYTVQVFDRSGAGGVVLTEVYDASPSPLTAAQRLVNISARGSVSPGAGALIGGFVVSGSSTKSVLIRGVGPGLAGYGVAGWLADPVLSVYDAGGNLVARNLKWGSQAVAGRYQANVGATDIGAAEASVGAFALAPGSADTALIASLPPGAYTFQVTSAGNSTGQALGEVYELP